MIVMGIDPGTALTGVAILKLNDDESVPHIHEVTAIKTKAGVDMHKRLHIMHDNLCGIAEKYSPDLMVVERLFFNTNVKTAMSVGQARGVTLLVAAKYGMKVVEYTALEAKKEVVGYGRASKKDMQEAVKEYMNLDEIIKPDDANDALAMILCFLKKDYTAFKNNEQN